MSVELDVANKIDAEVTGLTIGTNLFTGPVRRKSNTPNVPGSVPSEAVFCIATGGFPSIPFIDGGQKGREDRPTVQITVRSDRKDYDGGLALAEAVFAAIDMNPPAGYFDSRAVTSGPGYIFEDDQEHHMWSINVTLKRCA